MLSRIDLVLGQTHRTAISLQSLYIHNHRLLFLIISNERRHPIIYLKMKT